MHFRRVGAAQAAPAFQAAGRTWYLAAGPSLLCVIDGLTSPRELDWDNLGKPNATAGRAVAAVSAHLPETAGGDRARALLLVRTGDVQGAIAALQASLEQKKPFPDTWCLLGDALWSAGKKKAARAHYTSFIKKARKRDFPEAYERAKSRAG
jgi:tetratricopeptide (TPR) repeat protein